MPIVSNEIIRRINKPQGLVQLLMRATDQTGAVWEKRPHVPENNNDATTLAEWVIELEASLIDYEARAEATRASSSTGLPSEHQPQAEMDKSVLLILMQIEDALEFSKTLPWFRAFEVRAGANSNARATYLGVSSTDYALVADRYNQITGIKSGLEADAARVWDDGRIW